MENKKLSKPQKWIILGIPVLFIISSLIHSLYKFTGENFIIGMFAPVSESVWEHLKMVVLPIILWWTVYYFAKGKEYGIDKNKWFGGALISLLITLISIPLLYYFYTGAFGVHLLWVDIIIFLIALFFGQMLGLYYYNRGKGISASLVFLIFIIIIFLFILFTFKHPNLPIFNE